MTGEELIFFPDIIVKKTKPRYFIDLYKILPTSYIYFIINPKRTRKNRLSEVCNTFTGHNLTGWSQEKRKKKTKASDPFPPEAPGKGSRTKSKAIATMRNKNTHLINKR